MRRFDILHLKDKIYNPYLKSFIEMNKDFFNEIYDLKENNIFNEKKILLK